MMCRQRVDADDDRAWFRAYSAQCDETNRLRVVARRRLFFSIAMVVWNAGVALWWGFS